MRNGLSIWSFVILLMVLVSLTACAQATPTPFIQQTPLPEGVTVLDITEKSSAINKFKQVKEFNQCRSDGPFTAEVEFSQSNSQTIQQETTEGVTAEGGVALTDLVKVEIQGKLEQKYGTSQTSGQGKKETITIQIQPHTWERYNIIWQENYRNGTIKYRENGVEKTADYSYRIGLEMVSEESEDPSCPVNGVAVASPSPINALPSPFPPTFTPPPTMIPPTVSIPAFVLPFEDNFDDGLKPQWTILSGTPVFPNGQLHAAGGNLVLQIGDSGLADYTMSVDWLCGQGMYVIIAEKVRFDFYGNSWQWRAFKNNEWIGLQDINPHDFCALDKMQRLQINIKGNHYSVVNGGQTGLDGVYGDPISGPLTISIYETQYLDNFSITPAK